MSDIVERALDYVGEGAKSVDALNQRKLCRLKLPDHSKLRAPRLSSLAVDHLARKLAVTKHVVLFVADISERRFQRLQKEKVDLTEAESDRVLRIARVASDAERTFGAAEKARRWLSTESKALGGKPLDLLATDAGARSVELELIRIDFGEFS